MGYSSWGRKELDMTELLTHTHTHILTGATIRAMCQVQHPEHPLALHTEGETEAEGWPQS